MTLLSCLLHGKLAMIRSLSSLRAYMSETVGKKIITITRDSSEVRVAGHLLHTCTTYYILEKYLR
jgi:hypothetical protein